MSNIDSLSSEDTPIGFSPPRHRPLGAERGTLAVASLIASVALVVASLLVVAAISSGPVRERGEATASWELAAQRG